MQYGGKCKQQFQFLNATIPPKFIRPHRVARRHYADSQTLILSNDATAYVRESPIVPHEGTTPIRKSLILSNDATVWVREGPIVSHEGTTPIRKSLILSNDATVCVREGPVVPHEGMVSVASFFSGSLFITE